MRAAGFRPPVKSLGFESSSDPRSSVVVRFSMESPFSRASRLLPSVDNTASFFSATSISVNKTQTRSLFETVFLFPFVLNVKKT